MIKKINNNKGFTLIEMLVAVALFTIISIISTASLLAVFSANAKEHAVKSAVDNLHFALESITREIRVGTYYDCSASPSGGTATNDCSGGTTLGFTSSKNDFIVYRKNGTQIERSINAGAFIKMNDATVTINDFSFYVRGSSIGDNIQPLVTIVVEGVAGPADSLTTFNIQSTVTQRLPDF